MSDETIYQEAKKTVEIAREAVETVKNAAESAKETVQHIEGCL